MKKYAVTEFDIIFLSYDEPNKEKFWADLNNKAPWAKRVDGVKGIDSAHKACSNLSETDFFITVDGDNIVDDNFFNLEIEIKDHESDCAWSWDGLNYTNGLVYGNGGLKLWSKAFVENMHTHENAKSTNKTVDFCWDEKYKSFKGCWSTTYINETPYQAFRAGFREGVKMVLDQGERLTRSNFIEKIYPQNYNRLIIWMSIGADVENGLWSIYGSRLGTKFGLDTSWDISNISNYDWIENFWNSEILKKFNDLDDIEYLNYEIKNIGNELRSQIQINISELDPLQSKFVKDILKSKFT